MIGKWSSELLHDWAQHKPLFCQHIWMHDRLREKVKITWEQRGHAWVFIVRWLVPVRPSLTGFLFILSDPQWEKQRTVKNALVSCIKEYILIQSVHDFFCFFLFLAILLLPYCLRAIMNSIKIHRFELVNPSMYQLYNQMIYVLDRRLIIARENESIRIEQTWYYHSRNWSGIVDRVNLIILFKTNQSLQLP